MTVATELHRLDVFHHTAKYNSFVKAAKSLDISASMVSQHISKLEQQLDVKLFIRSTRLVRPTEAGRLLYQASCDVFERLDNACAHIDEIKNKPRGLISISAQSNFANIFLIPLLNEFTQLYPKVEFNLMVDDQIQDLKKEAIDVSFTVGEMKDSDYYSVKLQSFKIGMFASPDYLHRKRSPQNLQDVNELDCVVLNTLKEKNKWSFFAPNGVLESVVLKSAMQTNSGMSLVELAKSGVGLAIFPDFFVSKEVEAGLLVRQLTHYGCVTMGVYAVYHQQLHKSSYTIRCFIEFIKSKLI